MGNRITNTQVDDQTFKMSNGLTDVFMDTLCLAGSDMTTEEYQKDIMIWLAQRDSDIRGRGCSGFDISEIIWKEDLFEEQKGFIVTVIDLALQKKNWERLDYPPNEIWIFQSLSDFREMITKFTKEKISPKNEHGIIDFDGDIKRYDKCKIHGVYKHFAGCVVCDNAVNPRLRHT